MERTLSGFIRRYSFRQQMVIIFLTVLSFPITYLTLELPKRIVNEALGEKQGQALKAVQWVWSVFGSIPNQVDVLLFLSFTFLILVLISGIQKYQLNVYAGRLGEQMLRRLRFQLYASILRFPLPHFKKTSQGEIIPMVIAETDPIGGYIGEAWSIPAYQGGTLLVYLVFIFVTDFVLGLAAISLYPVQIWLIPKLQAKVNQLAKQRVRTARQLSDKIGESISGITEIRAHDATRLERADVASRLNRIYELRYEIFRRKFFIKFLNNFLAQLTPFFFYAIGGYLVIQRQVDIGSLVAVLAAYKDLSSPWKELLAYYQQKEDVRIKYEQVVEQFAPPGMIDEALVDADPDPSLKLGSPLSAVNLTYSEDGRVKTVEGVNFSIPLDKHVAVLGAGGSGKEDMMLLLARLMEPTAGSVQLGGVKLAQLPQSVTGRRLAYVSSAPYLFATTVRDNLFYGLKHRPLAEPEYDEAAKRARQRYVVSAEAAGNPTDDPRADWIDYSAADAADRASLERRALEALSLVDMDDDMYQLGLRGTIDPAKRPDLAAEILKARTALRERLVKDGQSGLVEPFDVTRYNENATLGENLLFGTPTDDRINVDRLAEHPYVLGVLEKTGLADDLLIAGRQVAETMVELFSGLAPGNELFERYSFISADDLPEYQALLARTANQKPGDYRAEDRGRLLSLPFKVIPARHRLGFIDDAIKGRVLEARRVFAAELPEELKGAVEFFDAGTYNGASTLRDNILFGKVAFGQAQAATKINRLLRTTLDELALSDDVMMLGLDFSVGIAGARLSTAQRQKVGLARAVLKRPEIMLLAEAGSALDGASQSLVVANLLKAFKGRGVIWALQRARIAQSFDLVLVMRGGRVIEQGTFKELDREGTALRELLQAE